MLSFIDSVLNKKNEKGFKSSNFFEIETFFPFIDTLQLNEYQKAFMLLLIDNYDAISKITEDYNKQLSYEENWRNGINGNIMISPRKIIFPEENSDKWEMLYETLICETDESGPISHFRFQEWNLEQFDIYYIDDVPLQ